MDGSNAKETTTQDIADLGGSGYLVYTALLSQTGTGAPVATVLQNTVGDIVWVRNSGGVYRGTLNGAFPLGKFWSVISYSGESVDITLSIERINDNYFLILVNDGIGGDGALTNTPIEIRVYP